MSYIPKPVAPPRMRVGLDGTSKSASLAHKFTTDSAGRILVSHNLGRRPCEVEMFPVPSGEGAVVIAQFFDEKILVLNVYGSAGNLLPSKSVSVKIGLV